MGLGIVSEIDAVPQAYIADAISRDDAARLQFTIGSSRNKTFEIIGAELLILVILSMGMAAILYSITGYFVEDFIRSFII